MYNVYHNFLSTLTNDFYVILFTIQTPQWRNQEFFKTGEVSWNKGTLINIQPAVHERKTPHTVKPAFKIKNVTY